MSTVLNVAQQPSEQALSDLPLGTPGRLRFGPGRAPLGGEHLALGLDDFWEILAEPEASGRAGEIESSMRLILATRPQLDESQGGEGPGLEISEVGRSVEIGVEPLGDEECEIRQLACLPQ